MSGKVSSFVWWVFAVLFTLTIAYYQRTTGPTYPIRGKIIIEDKEFSYKLLTSNDSDQPAKIFIKGPVDEIDGELVYRRYKTTENWKAIEMSAEGDKLVGNLPPEPPAGKLVYSVTLSHKGTNYKLSDEPVVIRFKGPVPGYVLWPHILTMFLAMLFSTRTGIEALRRGKKTFSYAFVTLILLLVGGMILGPVVQKYAFDAYWTGWPFGQDLTDNKTLVAFVAWIIAVIRLRKNRNNRGWAVAAALILLAVYLIPHSMFGSELDYSTGEIGTGN
jgi:hypothetical protein